MKYVKFLLLLLLQHISYIFSQEWHQVYFPNQSNSTYGIYETYDYGYILGGDFRQNSIPQRGLIIKTDINGSMLWYKVISTDNNNTSIRDINGTIDGGCVCIGFTGKVTGSWNPFILKLNVCGELDWCRIYNSPNQDPEWGQSIYEIPDGYIALIKTYGEDPRNQRIWLYKLDHYGDIIWTQCYAQSDTLIHGEISVKMFITNNYDYIINGYCYYPNPGNTTDFFLRPLIIKTDSSGQVGWELPWSVINGENYFGQSYMSIIDNYGNIYSSGRHIITNGPSAGDKPAFIKTDQSGNETFYTDLLSSTYLGLTYTLNMFTDSTLVFGASWVNDPGGDAYVGVIKTDTTGNNIHINEMFTSDYTFSDGEITYNNKLILVGGFWDGIWRSHAYKLNSDLDYDSVYTQTLFYDSLCPYPIVSDTIPLDCVVVGIDDPFTNDVNSTLKAYPNPVSQILTLELPEKLTTSNQTNLFTIKTTYYIWKNCSIEVYDLNGRLAFHQTILESIGSIKIDVSDWPDGLYVIRVIFGNEMVENIKVLVQKFL